MTTVWITDALLSFVCFHTGTRLWSMRSTPAQLASISLFLLSLASVLGTFRFLFNLETEFWLNAHELASRLFGIAGLYVLIFVWLDFSGLLRIHRPLFWAHAADGTLIFLLAFWLDRLSEFQLVVGIVMTVAALSAAWRCARNQQPGVAAVLAGVSFLFIINGLVITGAMTPLIGPILRIDVFHLCLAAWALGLGAVLKQTPLTLTGLKLP
ncbi:DUF6962 family protein [Reinekea blandensis]|uniref:Uncharacterized protein n=1 Tax=Reinekea blandensis MED297 TaxID=314283 RepID=A4BID0_9GAMM|nr:hypothetical protein [Reinekea blandensis]EAR08137.1 hypothetical protein MED297_00575 [Reinekea sp. MED297] [Reinekea blandensis MED297]